MTNFHFLKQSEKKPGELDTWSVILPFAFDLICGILLIALGNLALRVTSYALAGVMIISAIYMIIVYVRSKPLVKITELRLAGGLVLIVAGALLAFNPEYLENLLPFIWGIALLFGAFVKIQYAFDELALKIEKWWIMLILAAFSMVIGILTLANPAFLGENRNVIIGIMLIVEAIIDLVVFLLIRKALKNLAPSGATIPLSETRQKAAESAVQSAVAAAAPAPEPPAESEQ
jgi:uncharacterized membrane protein HdeD (DUF308 family)